MKIKNLKLALISLITIITFASPVFASAASLSLSPATGTINRGCNFSLNIELDTQGGQTDGTDVILIYETSKVSVKTTDITNGTIYSDYPGNSVDSAGGKLSISGISSVSQPFSGKGGFATVNFKVADNAPAGATNIKFDFDPNDKTKTTDTNVVEQGTIADLLSQVTDGSYTIGTGSCAAQTVPAGTGGPATLLGQGAPATISATPLPTKVPLKELPQSGILDNTVMIATVGTVLTILGILGLALL